MNKRSMLQIVCGACFAITTFVRAPVSAQAGGTKAAAEALFDDGRKLMSSGQYADACAKFEASQALDPGVGTSLNLADCYEKLGRTASAWAQFRETVSAARKAGSVDRERIARQRIEALEPKLSYLTVITWKGQEVEVTRDGALLEPAVLSTPIPVDPGEHTISAASSGKRSWSTKVSVSDNADRVSVSVPILADEPTPIAATQSTSADMADGSASAAPTTDKLQAGSDGSTQRALGIVAAAVGVAGLATGAVFGIKAASTWKDAQSSCTPGCDSKAHKLSQEASQSGTISTIGFIAGGVGLVAGGALFFTAPSKRADRQLGFSASPFGLDVHGSF
jgi:hypothetical protein